MPAAKPPKALSAKRRPRVPPLLKKPKIGRPTAYRKEYAEQAQKLAMLGLNDTEMAEFFCVGKSTFCQWKQKHAEFTNALTQGRTWADAQVTHSLYQRAIGCATPETHISNYQGEITLTKIQRHYPPEVQAIKYWLNNRQGKRWRDRVEVKEDIDLHIFPERETLEGVYTKIIDERQRQEARLAGRLNQLEQMDEYNSDDD